MINQPISCPFKLKTRPCKQITLKAESSLREELKKTRENSICTVRIGNIGIFDNDGMIVLKNYCYASTCKKEIDSEKYWFVNTVKKYPNLNNDAIRIQNVIWQNHRDHNICKIGDMDVNVGHLLSLCCERYLNDQVVDALIKRFWLQCTNNVRKKTICLTTFTCIWASLSSTQGDPSLINHLQQHLENMAKRNNPRRIDTDFSPSEYNQCSRGNCTNFPTNKNCMV